MSASVIEVENAAVDKANLGEMRAADWSRRCPPPHEDHHVVLGRKRGTKPKQQAAR